MRKKLSLCLGLFGLCGVGLGVSYYSYGPATPPVVAAAAATVTSPSRLRTLWTLSRLAAGPALDDATRPAPRPPPLVAIDPAAEERNIADSPALRAVAEKAGLQPEGARAIAHILEVYARSRDSLNAALTGDQQLATLQEQILDDTVAQLRTHIPESAWDTFEHSGLLALPTRGEDPTTAVNN